jgi:hypothetical protein
MSDTTIFADRTMAFQSFVSVEHGSAMISLSLYDSSNKQEVQRTATMTPDEARLLARDLMRRADLLKKE